MTLSAAADAPVAHADQTRHRAIFLAVLSAFLLFGLWLTSASRGNPAIGWMLMFAPSDFAAPGRLWPFLVSLQTGISPWLAALEVLSQRWFGTAAPVTVGLYRFCLVGAYLVAMALAWPSVLRLAIAAALSVVFLWATVLIHPATPIVYDVVLPFLLVAYFALLRAGASAAVERTARIALVLAGIALALADLTRPFMILFVPLLVAAAWFTLRNRARFIALVLPVLLIAGAWHAHQWVSHGQIAWSNHAGFNLIRAWRMVPYPELAPEPGSAPVAPERRANLNTPEHGENSRRLRRAVVDYVLANPLESARHMVERVGVLVGAGHQIDDRVVDHPVLPLYDFLVRYANILVLAGALAIAGAMLVTPRRAGAMLGRIENQSIGLVALSILVIAITESGEEARFQIGLLPLIALAPVPVLLAPDGTRRLLSARGRRIAWIAVIVLVAATEILVSGAMRRAMPALEGGRVAARTASVAGVTIRVAQFNVRGGAWRDAASEIGATAACLADIDLAGLVELRGGGPFGLKQTQLARLAEATGLAAIDAPAERRWWAPQFGNALLSRVTIERWKSAPLPRTLGVSHRAMIEADATVGGRTLRVMVAQIDNLDQVEQIAAIERAFRAAPSPAVLLADLGTSERMEPLLGLTRDPAFVVVTNQPPMPGAGMPGGYVIAKGLRKVAQDFCKGGVSMSPRIAVELAFDP